MPKKVFKNTSMVASKGRPQRSEVAMIRLRLRKQVCIRSKGE